MQTQELRDFEVVAGIRHVPHHYLFVYHVYIRHFIECCTSLLAGFPKQCPANCPCKKYNCNGGFQETCGFSEGFCAMIQTEPVEYKINWVRVYQDKNDPKQKVGCSTKERPTRTFIEAHEKRYKQDGDVSNYQCDVLLVCIYFFHINSCIISMELPLDCGRSIR